MSRYAALLFFLITAACGATANGPLPPIADKLPPDVRDAEAEFDRRVKTAFPVGTSESKAIATLEADGFAIGPVGPDGYRSADMERGDLICQTIWSARWRADAGTIREVFGVYGLRCP